MIGKAQRADKSFELQVSLTPQQNVVFIRPSGVTNRQWLRFCSHWRQTNILNAGETFELDINTFIEKKAWLRHGWTNNGPEFHVSVASELRALIKDSHKLALKWGCTEAQESDAIPDLASLGVKRTLTGFQKRDLLCLLSNKAGANFSVPGAGKTTVTLVLWRILLSRGDVDQLFVIAPKSAFEAWAESEPKEVFSDSVKTQIFSGEGIDHDTSIVVCNYEQLESESKVEYLRHWVQKSRVMLVLDEAHRVKGGAQSVRWLGARRLCQVAARVDLLTGTPMPQSYRDLANLFALSWPTIPRSFFSEHRLRSLTPGSVFVRTNKAELGLPPVSLTLINNPMGNLQSQIYSALKRAYAGHFRLASGESRYLAAKGRAVMTLLAVSSNPMLLNTLGDEAYFWGLSWPTKDVSVDKSLMHVIANYSKYEIPPKYEWVVRYCHKSARAGRKVLVWSNFVGNLRALERLLKPLEPALIYGKTASADRRSELKRFRESPHCNVLLTNPQTLGEGISLHRECHECIFVDRLYNAGLYLQALDRIHRLGLPPDQITKVYILESARSIDQKVTFRLNKKVSAMSAALNDSALIKSSLPEYLESTPDELLGLDELDITNLLDHIFDET